MTGEGGFLDSRPITALGPPARRSLSRTLFSRKTPFSGRKALRAFAQFARFPIKSIVTIACPYLIHKV